MKSIVAVLVVLVACAGANAVLLESHQFEGNWLNSGLSTTAIAPVGAAALVVDPIRGNVADFTNANAGVWGGNDPVFKDIIPGSTGQSVFGMKMTMAAWVKSTSTSTGIRRLIGKGVLWNLDIKSGKLELVVRSASSSKTSIVTDGVQNINDGLWHHVATVTDFTTGESSLYVDGNLDFAAIKTGTMLCDNDRFPTYFYGVGTKVAASSTAAGSGGFMGYMDDIRVYANEALTQEDIQALMMIPEPMTMALLGLGSMIMIRRKK